MRLLLVFLVLALTSCVDGDLKSCGDLLCGSDDVCYKGRCASQPALSACNLGGAEAPNGMPCELNDGTTRFCMDGICSPVVCGDGIVGFREACDDGNRDDGDACSGDCKSDYSCGNGIIDRLEGKVEQCDDGTSNSNQPDAPCRANCQLASCGDGILDPVRNEACDAGVANSLAPNSLCRPNCQAPSCGDNVVDTTRGERCDDGNLDSADGCRGDCRSDETCGNGEIDVARGEQCDDAAMMANGSCTPNCKLPACGDGIVQLGEQCDSGANNSKLPNATCRLNCRRPVCGDGITDDGAEAEQCDDGNFSNDDSCHNDCRVPACGDGIVDVSLSEQCDQGESNSNEANATCRRDCQIGRCGDGFVDDERGELCDLGPANSNAPNAACRTTCQPPRCGDQVTDSDLGELCDDGNQASNDGCSGDCLSDETCGNGYVDFASGEQCDDASPRALSSDGCTHTCRLEFENWAEPQRSAPSPRSNALLAAKSNGTLLLFGGINETGRLSDTWLWDGRTWRELRTASPNVTSSNSLVYSERTRRFHLFGLNQQNPVHWVFDGQAWSEVLDINPTTTLTAFHGTPAEGQFIAVKPLETLRYNEASRTWSIVAGAATPSGILSIAHDEVSTSAVMVHSDNGAWSTRVFDGAKWIKSNTTTPPGTFALSSGGPASLFAQEQNRYVQYKWIANNWQPGPSFLDTLPGPPTIAGRGAALYFASRSSAGAVLGHFFQKQVDEAVAVPISSHWPAGSYEARAAAFDPIRGTTTVFGGETYGGQYDGSAWEEIYNSYPLFQSAVFDPALETFVGCIDGALVFVESPGQVTPLHNTDCAKVVNEGRTTVVFFDNGTARRLINGVLTEVFAAPRGGALSAFAFDPSSGKLFAFGDGAVNSNALRVLNGNTWESVEVLGDRPPPRSNAQLVAIPERQSLIVIGGQCNFGEFCGNPWEYRKNRWTQLEPARRLPPNADGGQALYDPIARSVRILGGYSSPVDPLIVEELAWDNASRPRERCETATQDSDSDGLAGCADPDCWGRCTPFCPPRAAHCNRTIGCGDGRCDQPREDMLLCPADCHP